MLQTHLVVIRHCQTSCLWSQGGARSRLSAAAMQTVEDESSDEDAAPMHRFVASLSDARQVLTWVMGVTTSHCAAWSPASAHAQRHTVAAEAPQWHVMPWEAVRMLPAGQVAVHCALAEWQHCAQAR